MTVALRAPPFPTEVPLRSLPVCLAAAFLTACHTSPAKVTAAPPPAAAAATPPPVEANAFAGDPALLRRELLRRLDADIEAMATRAHLQARLAIHEVAPIPYLGLDADPADGGMTVTAVYGGTGAKAAGLQRGDLLLSIGGNKVDSHATLAHAIRLQEPGSTLTVQVLRDGKQLELHGVLGQRPEEDEDEDEQFPDLPGGLPQLATAPRRFDFEGVARGSAPVGFETVLGGHGAPPSWIIAAGNGGQCLRQDSMDRTGIHFPMLLANDYYTGNVVATARMRYAGGEVDKAGGIVLHYHDAGNYYVARVNAAEGDLRIFRVQNGIRRTLPGGRVLGDTDDGDWHTLEFRIEDSVLTATLDGSHTCTAYDSFFLRGRGGVWTKSDSQTEFDDLQFTPLPAK